MRLDEIGLINSNGFILLDLTIDNDPSVAIINQSLVMLISANNEKSNKCSIDQYPFTRIGTEIATLIGETTSDDDFIMFAKEVAKDHSFKVSVHMVNFYSDNTINYSNNNLLLE